MYSFLHIRDVSSRFNYSGGEAGAISALACAGVVSILAMFTAVMYHQVTKCMKTYNRTNIPPYLVSLLLSNVLQATATIMNAKWAVQGFVGFGDFCMFQGAARNAANVGNATWSLIIAAHTFSLLFLRWEITRISLAATLIGGWSFVIMIVLVGPTMIETQDRGTYFGVADYWCWITDKYPRERMLLEYFIEFFSVGLGFILYMFTLVRCRGNLVIVNGKWKLRWIPSNESWKLHMGKDTIDAAAFRVVSTMVWYPVAYSILLVPVSFARFSAFSGKRVPFWVTIITDTIFNLTGLVNSLLFIFTRRILPDTAVLPEFSSQRPDLINEDADQDVTIEKGTSYMSELVVNRSNDTRPYIMSPRTGT